METQKRESWGSSIGFILAIAGSAVGLGNVWKFPYITGLNGGGAFVLVYLFCILLVGMPVMLCEIVIGRRTRKNPYGAFKALQLRRSRFADIIGGFLLAAALLLSCSGSFGFAVIAAIAAVMMLTMGFAAVGLFSLITAMLILSADEVLELADRLQENQLLQFETEIGGKTYFVSGDSVNLVNGLLIQLIECETMATHEHKE